MFQPRDYSQFATQYVACACCGSTNYIIAAQGDRYEFGVQTVACSRCGLLFTNPRPPSEWFDEFYRYHYRIFYKSITTPDENYLNQDWVWGRHERNLNFLTPYLQETGTVMDIGASEGAFLYQFRQRCPLWKYSGVEPSENFSNFAREHFGLDTIVTRKIDDLGETQSSQYDLVTTNHVLEHLLDPNHFFLTARNLLKDGGLLFLDVPDADAELRGIEALHIAHVYHFSLQSLGNFLIKHGFELLTWNRWPHRLPWTIQVIARKLKKLPQEWSPPPVNVNRIACNFAKNSQNTVKYRIYTFLYRQIYKPIRELI